VPCSQFFNQEPGSPEEIINAISYVRPGNGFMPNFKLMEKSDVNGENRIPVYDWVLNQCPPAVSGFQPVNYLMYSPLNSNDIRWNFEKILIDQEGQPFRRYSASTEVEEIIPDIEALVGARAQ